MNKQQLANRIWASANKMRSKIEANEYKDYILGLIFYKFLSDNLVNHLKTKAFWEDEDIKCLVEDYDDAEANENINYCKENIGYFIGTAIGNRRYSCKAYKGYRAVEKCSEAYS